MPAADKQDQQLSAQQERVRKLAETHEGPEKNDLVELYVRRIAEVKTSIMSSTLSDVRKNEELKKIDNYLSLLDATNIKKLQKEYRPLFKSIEAALHKEVVDSSLDDREAKLEAVTDVNVRKELLSAWKEATKFKQKYDTKRHQIEILIDTKKLQPEGTELQYFMTAVSFHANFLDKKFKDYYESDDVGTKHERLKDIIAHGETFMMVLNEVEERLKSVGTQLDLRTIDLNDRSVLAEQAMFMKRMAYDDVKAEFVQKMDAMKISKNDPIRQKIELTFQAADTQFDTFKELALMAKTPAERTAAAEQAIKLLDQANAVFDGANKYLDSTEVKDSFDRGMSATKIFEQVPALKKLASVVPLFIMPQFAVGLGYYEAGQKGDSTTDTVLEVTDFGISLIPIVGGCYDIFAAARGKTLSGRDMGTGERVVRGSIGAISIGVDVYTFGVGGTLIKAGAKALTKAGVEITAKVAAKTAVEAGTKGVVKAGEKAVFEGLAKEAPEIVFKGLQKGASSAERLAAQDVLKQVVAKSLEGQVAEIGAKEAARLAEETAKVATRRTTGIAGFANRALNTVTLGAYEKGGVQALEKGIIEAGTKKSAIEAAQKAGKEVIGPYYLQAQFVKDGEVMWGGIAKSIGKETGKAWLHMHNPLEVLKTLQTPARFLNTLLKRVVKGVPANMYMNKAVLAQVEQSARATLIADGHDAKTVDTLFADVKEKPWRQVMKEHENNPIMKDPELQTFFKDFQEQFPKSLGKRFEAVTDLYSAFRALETDPILAASMAVDARSMSWADFSTRYARQLQKATPDHRVAFEQHFEYLHSLSRELPVNINRVKAERARAQDVVNVSKEQAVKLKAELEVLQTEKAQIESILEQFSHKVISLSSRTIKPEEKWSLLFNAYEKLPAGPLKNAINEFKDQGLHVAGSQQLFGNVPVTGHSVEFVVSKRALEVDELISAKARELGIAETEVGLRQGVADNKAKGHIEKLESAADRLPQTSATPLSPDTVVASAPPSSVTNVPQGGATVTVLRPPQRAQKLDNAA